MRDHHRSILFVMTTALLAVVSGNDGLVFTFIGAVLYVESVRYIIRG